MQARKSISKRLRFEVFKRDFFKCQYCGSVPPNVILEIDHIHPVCKGGKNNIDNLLTACFDCNRGKGRHEVSDYTIPVVDKSVILKEKISQYKAFLKLQSEMDTLLLSDIEKVNAIYELEFPEWTLSDKFKMTSVKKFINALGSEEVKDAMWIACSRIRNSTKAIKYFCGVCWSKIRDRQNGLY